jgi:hypothetical protein
MPEVYNGYQQAQRPKVEKAMTQAQYVASFIGHEPRRALFVGLYRVVDWKSVSFDEYWKIPANVELKSFGMTGLTPDRSHALWFDLEIMDFCSDWKGKLIIQWPGLERSWWRWSDEAMPSWEQLDLTWNDLRVLPKKWRNALEHWRGIYLIWDAVDGKGYVGAAYGKQNLLGRWQNYSRTGHGRNAYLLGRSPESFHFTILERVSPDLEERDIINLESTWKDRLHTRHPYGLNDN